MKPGRVSVTLDIVKGVLGVFMSVLGWQTISPSSLEHTPRPEKVTYEALSPHILGK